MTDLATPPETSGDLAARRRPLRLHHVVPLGEFRARPSARLGVDRARVVAVSGALLAVAAVLLPTGAKIVLVPAAFIVPGHAVVAAVFGERLPFGGFRRLGLTIMLSMCAYAVLAYAVFATDTRMSETTVAVSVVSLTSICAAIITRRELRRRAGAAVPAHHPRYRRGLDIRAVLFPSLAIAGAIGIAAASVLLLPRKAPDEFHAIALDGAWALTNRIVAVPADEPVEITVRTINETTSPAVHRVEARLGEQDWQGAVIEVPDGRVATVEVRGTVPAGTCLARLEIELMVDGAAADREPLAIWMQDRAADCG